MLREQVVGMLGLEPSASVLSERRSNQVSYTPVGPAGLEPAIATFARWCPIRLGHEPLVDVVGMGTDVLRLPRCSTLSYTPMKYPQRDSNPRPRIKSPVLNQLSYEGMRTPGRNRTLYPPGKSRVTLCQ